MRRVARALERLEVLVAAGHGDQPEVPVRLQHVDRGDLEAGHLDHAVDDRLEHGVEVLPGVDPGHQLVEADRVPPGGRPRMTCDPLSRVRTPDCASGQRRIHMAHLGHFARVLARLRRRPAHLGSVTLVACGHDRGSRRRGARDAGPPRCTEAWAVDPAARRGHGHPGRRLAAARSSGWSTYRSRRACPTTGRRFDRLVAIPFRQVAERGFEAHDDGTPLVVVDIEHRAEVPLAELLAALPDDAGVEFADRGGFETDDEEYGDVVERDHPRRDRPRARAPTSSSAGTTARQVARLGRRQGADRASAGCSSASAAPTGPSASSPATGTSIGASPERHVSRARRRRPDEPDQRHLPARAGSTDRPSARQRLLDFLADEKEIYELFMVVDEELKMMCDICHEGGQVLGPFLKPMTHLVHTEYLLAGRTDRDVREVLRDTMYAATVTGVAGRERLPADQAVRDRGARLLRRRARAARPRRARAARSSTARS